MISDIYERAQSNRLFAAKVKVAIQDTPKTALDVWDECRFCIFY